MATIDQMPASTRRGKRFVVNVAWTWLGVAAMLVTGFIVSPYLIRKLGAEAYGIWALSFALVEYYWFLDFGFRSATVKYVAHYWATEEPDKVNETINTGLLYSLVLAFVMFGIVLGLAPFLDHFFQISPAYRSSFKLLVGLVTFSWCFGAVFNTFGACLEAVQRFDLSNKANIVQITIRSAGTLILLYLGYGLIPIGILTVSSLIVMYCLNFYFFVKIFPKLRLSTSLASLRTLKMMGHFGIHTFVMNISNMALNQTPQLLLGHFRNAVFVTYYNLPMRLIQLTGEAIGRIGIITNSNTAELQARGDGKGIKDLAVYTNRYCITLFMPLAIVLWIYGPELFHLWVPSIAQYSAPLLPILLTGYMIAVVGQYSSAMLLQGLGRHKWYSRGLFVEAVAACTLLVVVIPRYGVVGAAWVVSVLMVLNRGIFAPWLVSREMHFQLGRFLHSIYTWPVVAAIPVFLFALWLQRSILPGTSWLQLLLTGCIVASLYYAIAFFSLPPSHRALLGEWMGRKLRSRASVVA